LKKKAERGLHLLARDGGQKGGRATKEFFHTQERTTKTAIAKKKKSVDQAQEISRGLFSGDVEGKGGNPEKGTPASPKTQKKKTHSQNGNIN